MTPPHLPSRNGHHSNGPEYGATVAGESASPCVPDPSGAETSLPHAPNGDRADSPITLNSADLAAPNGSTGDAEASPVPAPAYGALLWGPWPADLWAPIETLAASVVQNVRGAVVVLDADLRVRLANRAFCQTFQVAPDRIEGRRFPDLGVGEPSAPRPHAFLDQIVAHDGQIEGVEVEHDDPTTGRRIMAIQGRKLVESGAGNPHILLEIEDVTECEAAERHRRELIVTAVHEMRNPLTAIKGYAQLMQQRNATSEKALTTILNRTQQLSRLVDDLLDSTGVDIAHPLIQPSLMDLVKLARASAEQAQPLSPGHVIRLEVPEEPLEGLWDEPRLSQVFANLLGNAVKYSPNGGEIVVCVEDLGPTVRVSISNQGTGIAADALPRIFDQFFRVSATAHQVPGLGLGLHVCKALVEAHGGSISVQSILGMGSTFAVELPRTAPAPPDRADALIETARCPETVCSSA